MKHARFVTYAIVAFGAVQGCVGDDPEPSSSTPSCLSTDCPDGGATAETGPKLSLGIATLEPSSVTLARGETVKVKVTIDRSQGVTGPVSVTVDGLPEGVTAAPITIDRGAFAGEIGIVAADDAAQRKPAPVQVGARADTGESAFKDLAVSVRGTPGTLDLSFGTSGSVVYAPTAAADELACLAIDPQGRIYVAGTVADAATTAIATARFTVDGALDTSWGQAGKTTTKPPGTTKTTGRGCMLDAKGRFVVVGSSTSGAGEIDFAVVRFLTGASDSGTLDTTFGASGVAIIGESTREDEAFAVAQIGATNDDLVVAGTSGGTIYAAVMDSVATNVKKSNVAAGGTYDGPPLATAMGLARGPLTTVLVAGYGKGGSSASNASAIFWPIETASSITPTFSNSPHYGTATFTPPFAGGRLAVQADKKPIMAGGSDSFALVRWVAGGLGYSIDPDFGGGKLTYAVGSGASAGTDLVIQADGKIIVVGGAVGDGTDFAVLRVGSTGELDSTFGTGGKTVAPIQQSADDYARAVALAPDGRIVVAGETKTAAGTSDWALQRFWP